MEKNNREIIKNIYEQMYQAMIEKNKDKLEYVLDDCFYLLHMTGMKRKNFIQAILDGTLNYYSAIHENIMIDMKNDNHAVCIGQSYVTAAVFGGRKSHWHLQLKCKIEKINGIWKILSSVASTY